MFPNVQLGFPAPFPPLIIPTHAEVAAAGLKALWESTFPDEAPCTIFRVNGVAADTNMVTHQPFLLKYIDKPTYSTGSCVEGRIGIHGQRFHGNGAVSTVVPTSFSVVVEVNL